jgi:hypothetical protein
MLWEDATGESARHSLRTLLHKLRSQIEVAPFEKESLLQTKRDSVRLNSLLIETDVAEFDALLIQAQKTSEPTARLALMEQALNLYRGGLLPGYYDEWVLEERNRLLVAHENLSTAYYELLSTQGVKSDPQIPTEVDDEVYVLEETTPIAPFSSLPSSSPPVPHSRYLYFFAGCAFMLAIWFLFSQKAPPSSALTSSALVQPPSASKPASILLDHTLDSVNNKKIPQSILAQTVYGHDAMGTAVVPIPGGGAYVIGFAGVKEQSNNFVINQLDSNLKLVRATAWDNPQYHNDDRAKTGVLSSEGNLTVAGFSSHKDDWDGERTVVQFDKDLKVRWEQWFGLSMVGYPKGQIEHIASDSHNGIWVGGIFEDTRKRHHAGLAKLEGSTGEVVRVFLLEPEETASAVVAIMVDKKDDSLYVIGRTTKADPKHPYDKKEVGWIRHYDASTNEIKEDRAERGLAGRGLLAAKGRAYFHSGNFVLTCMEKGQPRKSLPLFKDRNGSIEQIVATPSGDILALCVTDALYLVLVSSDLSTRKWVRKIESRDLTWQGDLHLKVNRKGEIYVGGTTTLPSQAEPHYCVAGLDSGGKTVDVWLLRAENSPSAMNASVQNMCLENENFPLVVGQVERQRMNIMRALLVKPPPKSP